MDEEQPGMKIIIVDDNAVIREGLKYFLEKKLDCEIIGEASNGFELLGLENINTADIILLDIHMPGMDGIRTAERLSWQFNHVKTIAITMHENLWHLTELIGAGFKGCVFKHEIYENLPHVMETVMNGNVSFPNGMKLNHNRDI